MLLLGYLFLPYGRNCKGGMFMTVLWSYWLFINDAHWLGKQMEAQFCLLRSYLLHTINNYDTKKFE